MRVRNNKSHQSAKPLVKPTTAKQLTKEYLTHMLIKSQALEKSQSSTNARPQTILNKMILYWVKTRPRTVNI